VLQIIAVCEQTRNESSVSAAISRSYRYPNSDVARGEHRLCIDGQYVLFLQFFASCDIDRFCVSYESPKATPSLGGVISITPNCD
jgi:hypothetical protein